MKTFTVRDLDRQPAAVLDACDREGAVRIRRRGGQSYIVRPDGPVRAKASVQDRCGWLAEHLAWRASLVAEPIDDRQTTLVDRLLGGQ